MLPKAGRWHCNSPMFISGCLYIQSRFPHICPSNMYSPPAPSKQEKTNQIQFRSTSIIPSASSSSIQILTISNPAFPSNSVHWDRDLVLPPLMVIMARSCTHCMVLA